MPGTDTFVQLAPDSTGKQMRTFTNVIGGQTVHQQVTTLFDKDGNELITAAAEPAATDRGLVVRVAGGNRSSSATALSALNATVSVPLAGKRGAGFKGITTGTAFVGAIVPEVSFDGGTTWIQTYLTFVNSTFGSSGYTDNNWGLNSASETLYWRILVPGGATDVRIRVSSYTSGTITGTMVATDSASDLDLTSGRDGTGTAPLSGKVVSGMDPSGFHRYLRQSAKGAQSAFALQTQDFKDTGRNMTNYFMSVPILTTAADVLMSLTGYKGGAAVTATTTPAVVTAGKIYRVNYITITYIATATAGEVRVSLRANLSGVVAVGSPIVQSYVVGTGTPATAGSSQTESIPIPEGMEFAAGTGIGITIVGLGVTGAVAIAGYAQVSIKGYEY
jgi:hypothetical protein